MVQVYGDAWCMVVHGVWWCMVYGGACCMVVHGVWWCMVYGGALCMVVHGVCRVRENKKCPLRYFFLLNLSTRLRK